MERPPFLQTTSPVLKILAFVIILFATLLFTSMLGLLIGVAAFGSDTADRIPTVNDLADPVMIAKLKYFQLISQLGIFIFPVILFTWLATRERAAYLYLKSRVQLAPILVSAAILLVGLPLINWLVEINMQLTLPESMSGIENWMKQSESDAGRITEAFLSTGNAGGFIVNVLIIAIIPAIGEELLFRGILMRLFREWTKNIHATILITAALFSFIHFQFYGFLPRFLMGVLFGYMLYWSGSLWMPVIAHFVNNVTAVIVAFLAATGKFDVDFNTFGETSNPLIIIISALSVGLLVVFLWMKRKKEVVLPVNTEEPGLD